jgi:ribonucleoside-diphosphate reductase alpha chain
MDYCVQLNQFFYDRVKANEWITLFSPHDVPDMYEAFFADQDEFKRLYEAYETQGNLETKQIRARDLFRNILKERQETARLYIFHADHVNSHGSFKPEMAPIRMTNLCVEITLPTVEMGLNFVEDGRNSEIALCTLAGSNWGGVTSPDDFEETAILLVRALDNLLDYQEYPEVAADYATHMRRPLGIGVISLAHFLAKRGLKYNSEAYETVHEYAEAWSYYLIKASVDLAEERGPCMAFEATRYSDGIMPIDTYCRSVDELVEPVYRKDWDTLRARAKEYGIRNSTLMALMPAETSAQAIEEWNGIEPAPALVTQKKSKHGVLSQVVPNIQRLKNRYDLRWDMKPEDYIKLCAILQKFVDQSGSYNTSHNPHHYPDGKIPMSQLMKDCLLAHKYGLKTLYYANAYAESEEEIHALADLRTPGLVDVIIDDEPCDSCVL